MTKNSGKNRIVAGIDLGTNNSSIAIYKLEKAEVLRGADDSKRLLGTKANDPLCKLYKNQWTFDTKRDISTGYCNYKIGGKIYTPEEISAEVLKKLVTYAGEEEIDAVVLTVPAYFTSEQKEKILEAAKMADLEVLQLICEPTAAAIAYGMEHAYINNEILFVFDMGGGTFDITIIKIQNSKDFTVIALGGDSHLGGRDFDGLIVDWMLKELEKQIGKIVLSPRKKHKMNEMAKEAKEALSQAVDAALQLSELDNNASDVTFTRKDFEKAANELLEKVKDSIITTLKCRQLKQQEINHVLFVGGASKMPMIANILKALFKEAKFSSSIKAEEIVALGATRLAAKLSGQSNRIDIQGLNVQDVTSSMIGIEIFEDNKSTFKKIFDCTTPYGTEMIVPLATTEDNQTKCEIPLYEGLSANIEKNNYIGSIIINDLKPRKKGEITINVHLQINKNGILSVVGGESNCVVYYETQLKSVN
uniref:Uncharacterized protein n=1 Tax=Panagrolaimus sp. ES5 TaxID=591445 RepID=A0AC34FEW0_9BILA